MDKLLEILEDINPDNDYMVEDKLIDAGLLDSMSLLELVSTIEDSFGVQITPTELIPANFNSAKAMWDMIQRLKKE